MGCFGKNKAPEIKIPDAPKLPTAKELFDQGIGYGQQYTPLAFGARENALQNIDQLKPTPEFFSQYNLVQPERITQDYYNQFGPTSFEQALGNQYFQNIFPDVEANIKHNLSLSGVANSPILAQQIAKAQGQIGYDVGRYLSDLGQTRASQALGRDSELIGLGQRRAELGQQGINNIFNAQLSIDPFQDVIGPYVGLGQSQGNAQANLNYNTEIQRAQADYQRALQDYQNKQAMISSIAQIGGGALGFAFGGPGGAAIGSSIGGTAAPLFGGSGQPAIGFGDAMSIFNSSPQGGYGSNTPRGTMDMGNYSRLPTGGGGGGRYVYPEDQLFQQYLSQGQALPVF